MTDVWLLILICAAIVVIALLWRRTRGQAPTGEISAPSGEEVAQDMDAARQGVRAFMRGDYTAAFPLLESAARNGHLKAQILLSKMYFAGNGVSQDKEQYAYWLARAAENGDKPSKAKLKRLRDATAKTP